MCARAEQAPRGAGLRHGATNGSSSRGQGGGGRQPTGNGSDGMSAGGGGGGGGGGSKKGGAKGGGTKQGMRLVTRTELRHDLTGRMLKLLWPEDNTWWDGQVRRAGGRLLGFN